MRLKLLAGSLIIGCAISTSPAYAHVPVEEHPSTRCVGVELRVGSKIQNELDAHPPGTTFCLGRGVYRLTEPLRPKSRQSLVGQHGTVLNGARRLRAFRRVGRFWVIERMHHTGEAHGVCNGGYVGCRYAEGVFLDDEPLWQVTSLTELSPGAFYFDYDRDRIFLVDDPRGRNVEVTIAPGAIWAPSAGTVRVTVARVVMEKFQNPAQVGVIDFSTASGWTVRRVEVRRNHGVAVAAGRKGLVADNHLHHNGQLGVSARGAGVRIVANEIDHNNTAGFAPGWEAGGSKFWNTKHLVVSGNHVHHNHGPGLWTDTGNVHTTYDRNIVEANDGEGIFHEASYDAVIRGNYVSRNGFGNCVWMYGAGILVAHSPNVEVSGNTVIDNCNGISGIQQDRGSGRRGRYELARLFVHHNRIEMTVGRTGVAQDMGSSSVFAEGRNRFVSNTYRLRSLNGRYFEWADGQRTKAEWRSYGNDVRGSYKDT